ncbi:MAG TPA: ExeM/NucH family extracellular endonuclease, partial [Chloroflexota bacterium]|nr:ExeM/NucH family extracellular endonuclease [Chloroflexota bacterium]
TPQGGVTVAADPKINEFSASTAGTDVEYVEIIGDPHTNYAAYTILEIEGDSGTAVGTVDEVINLGTTDANGLYLVNLPANALENGSITLLLVKNFTGALNADLDTNNDGVLDTTPWEAIVDSVAVNDGGAGDVTYGAPTLGVSYDGLPFAPGGASRIPDGLDTDSAADWVRNDFDLAGIPGFPGTPDVGEAYNTPGELNAIVPPPTPQLVINEIDYDQPSTDTAEFVEIKNNGSAAVSLSGWTLELVNGNGGGAVIYDTIALPNVSLAAGDYFVVCANAATVPNCDLDDAPDTNFIQNGAPDAVGLRFNGDLMDAVSYAGNTGAPYTEGSGIGLVDSAIAGEGISRCPDGSDTNQNNVDFVLTGITPGAANDCASADPQLTINDVTLNEGDSGTTTFSFTVNLGAPAAAGGVTFDIATADGTATSPDDFTAKSLTGQTIPAGSSIYTFSVLVNGDTSDEPDESFFVNISNVTGAIVADGQGQGTILNDDNVAITRIHTIQGSGDTAVSGTFTVEAIVVGSYQTQDSGQLRGFFIQEEDADADADPSTSEGIFVFCSGCPKLVSVGDKVRVTGSSSEYFGMSQLTASTAASVTIISSSNALPTPATVQLPVPGVPTGNLAAATAVINAYFEPFEGMLVTFPATLSVSEYFELARYGQVILTEGGRPHTFTAVNTPTAAGYINHQIDLASRKVILDDTDNRQNRPTDAPNTAYYYPIPGLSTGNYFRGGDTIANLTGVLHWSFAGQTGTDAWRIRPVPEAFSYAFTPVNTRPAVPEVQGSLKIASFNVLNYFLTIDTTSSNDSGFCGPSGTQDCRGADSVQELERQRTKLLAALSAIDADVFGFMEMENTPGVEPLADIVAGLPGYDYIDTGAIGGDAIRVGIIYKTATVQPVGDYAILTSSVDPRFNDARNRPALAQTFEEIATGERVTVVVNHLKSKGSGCGAGDDDTTTGQGNCNGTRTLAAQALADWLATDPTGSGDADVLIIGDLNSYAQEDPIVALQNAGYTDLVASFGGANAYGYVFDGQLGYLDHALSNASLTPQVADVAEWHINADEIPLFDYNDDVRDPGERDAFEEESDVFPLYEPNAFRTSDHDPVIIGLNLFTPNNPPTVDAGGPYVVVEGGSVLVTAVGADPDGDPLTYEWDLDNDGLFETAGQSATFSAALLSAPGSHTIVARVTDTGGLTATDQATVSVVYNFTGFFQPVENLPAFNLVTAGSAIPMKFSLNGDKGLNIFAPGFPTSVGIGCDTGSPENDVQETVTAGSSSLSYDPDTDTYTYVWKTAKVWKN